MRLNRQQLRALAEDIYARLASSGTVKFEVQAEEALLRIEKALADDLSVEDRLNDEVREILKAYEAEISQGRMDYKTMFDLVKKKLVRERNLVL